MKYKFSIIKSIWYFYYYIALCVENKSEALQSFYLLSMYISVEE